MAKNLVYYTVFGREIYYDILRTSLESLVDYGQFDGDVLVISDKPLTHRGVTHNLVIPLADAAESIQIRITCHRLFPFDQYDKVLFLDSDILVCRNIRSLFEYPSDFVYFPQVNRYCTHGFIDAAYFDTALWKRNWWKRVISAGQYVLSCSRFAEVMRAWEAVCDRFAKKATYEMDQSFKKTWRDQIALNYLIRSGQLTGMEKADVVYFPLNLLALRPFPMTLHSFFPESHILWHYAGIPAPLAFRAMRRRFVQLEARTIRPVVEKK